MGVVKEESEERRAAGGRKRRRRRGKEEKDEEAIYVAMASTLSLSPSLVVSRLDAGSYLDGCPPACLLACPLARSLARSPARPGFSRLLEKPDSSCAKLCFPSPVFIYQYTSRRTMLDAMHVHDGAPANGPRVSPRVVHREVPPGLPIPSESRRKTRTGGEGRGEEGRGEAERAAWKVLKGPRCHRP